MAFFSVFPEEPNATSSTRGGTIKVNFFPHLPAYSDPKTGLLSKLPRSWIPYAQLMRLDRRAGFYAFYLPYLIGIMYAACTTEAIPSPSILISLAACLLPFNILLRGAACTWNDNVDQEFDRRVARCRHRPIARGAVSTTQGHMFTFSQAVLMLGILALFPATCKPHAMIILVLFFVYALMKRITYYPQVFLGIPFSWAILFCNAIFGMHFMHTSRSTLALIGANILWTITYDTIYAHQDVKDDKKAGVKSMALRFQSNTKVLCSVLSFVQVLLLAVCGIWSGFGRGYFIGTVGGVAVTLGYYLWDVDLLDPESCGRWFGRQFWMVGGSTLAGLVSEYLRRISAR